MKVLFKKIISTVTLCAMILSFAGCGGNVANSDMTKVTVWSKHSHNKSFMNEKINEWNETVGKEKKIFIDYKVQEGDINQKVDVAFTSEQAPDIFMGGDIAKLVENDWILSLEEIEGGKELIDTFDNEVLLDDVHKYNNKIYTLPYSVVTYGLIYNKDMFRAAGIVDENGKPTPPETLEELREYAKKLTNKEKNEYGMILPGKYDGFYYDDILKTAAVSSGHVGFNTSLGRYDYSAEGEVMKTYIKMKQDGSFYPGIEGLDNDPARAKFAAGGIGMKTAGSYDFGVLTNQFPTDVDWGVAPFPTVVKGERYKGYMDTDAYMKINAETKERGTLDKVFEVYKWLYSDELMIEGFKQGFDLPVKAELVADVEIPADMEAWRSFALLKQISTVPGPSPKKDMGAEKGMDAIWKEDIWHNNLSDAEIDDIVKRQEKTMENAINRYKDTHADYEIPEECYNPKWIIKVEK